MRSRSLLLPMVASTVAVGVLVAVALISVTGDAARSMPVLDLAVAIVSVALVPVMVRWPVPAGLVLSALAALSPVATAPATVAALHTARRRPFRAALAVAAAGIAGHAVLGWWRPTPGITYGWWLLLVTIAYAALVGWGALARSRADLLASLRERARRAEAEQERRVVEARIAERARIAREMHDVLAHRLSLLATYAGALEYRPDAPPERLAAAAGVVRAGVRQALEEMREVVTLLREDGDESDRPAPTLADVPGLVAEARDAGLDVRLDTRTDLAAPLAPSVGRTAYRVVQESLTNARRHSPGNPVTVVIGGAGGAELTIEVGNPLSPAPVGHTPGTGLIGLAERVHLAGGEITHTAADGEFRLRARIPWRQP
ncbi:signal transduction histidine kinase [Allocatelliglobosispora scoriae]|uniref:histidine kinase n=1 Tax=Allocatelliglobosispora scoriae TaxID=643052 RepID=A0A841BIV3_9ACTN|nr:histidine kinase [Allocatelliglobosispora scoriae]MBB5867545.1 signal transduction histidine kinase [Allocatelliglobosispora scoriae]